MLYTESAKRLVMPIIRKSNSVVGLELHSLQAERRMMDTTILNNSSHPSMMKCGRWPAQLCPPKNKKPSFRHSLVPTAITATVTTASASCDPLTPRLNPLPLSRT
ncbi:hypothetical protein NQZ68_029532 [Dissostichus eleginoides]|nr:hypothetical protein NQZ68_029532 [Dissostichus eleginoides]